jgi:hypothetical protein
MHEHHQIDKYDLSSLLRAPRALLSIVLIAAVVASAARCGGGAGKTSGEILNDVEHGSELDSSLRNDCHLGCDTTRPDHDTLDAVCGECGQNEFCSASICRCQQQCEGKECGADGCGGTCGACAAGQSCAEGKCLPMGTDCDDGNDVPWDGCTNGQITEVALNPGTDCKNSCYSSVFLSSNVLALAWVRSCPFVDFISTPPDYRSIVLARVHTASPEVYESTTLEQLPDDDGLLGSPFLSLHPTGVLATIWDVGDKGGEVSKMRIHLQESDGTLVADQSISVPVPIRRGSADFVGLQDSGWIGCWLGAREHPNVADFWIQRFSVEGEPEGPAHNLTEQEPGAFLAPISADVTDEGNLLLSWSEWDGQGPSRVRLELAQGLPLPPATSSVLYPSSSPLASAWSTVALADDAIGVAWMADDGDSWGIHFQRFSNGLLPIGQSLVVNEQIQHEQLAPAITATPGGFAVVWKHSVDPYSSDLQLFLREFDHGGNLLGPQTHVNEYSPEYEMYGCEIVIPTITSSAEGILAVVWSACAPAGGVDVFFRLFSPNTER